MKEIFTATARPTTTASSTPTRPRSCAARKAGIVTGLPDAYGRGRIIGDYRRVPLYGVDALVATKQAEKAALDDQPSHRGRDPRPRGARRADPRARGARRSWPRSYGFDVRRPAATAHEAVQWLYLAYLAATKEQNGAAMSLGRCSTFLDVYLQRDLDEGRLDERGAQELVDDLVIKLRLIRFLRTPEYDALFSGDPTWVTESIGGIGADGRPLVTRTSFRFLKTLYNLGPAPEPNLTVLWSPRAAGGRSSGSARRCRSTPARSSTRTTTCCRPRFGDDTAIACCVSADAGRQAACSSSAPG